MVRVELAEQSLPSQGGQSFACREVPGERGRANGDECTAQHRVDLGVGPAAMAPANAGVNPIVEKICRLIGMTKLEADIRVPRPPPRPSGRQPLGGEIGRDADRQGAFCITDHELSHRPLQRIEARGAIAAQALPFLGELDPSVQSSYQGDAEVLLQMAHMVAQRRLRHVQFLGGSLETAVPADGFECSELIQER